MLAQPLGSWRLALLVAIWLALLLAASQPASAKERERLEDLATAGRTESQRAPESTSKGPEEPARRLLVRRSVWSPAPINYEQALARRGGMAAGARGLGRLDGPSGAARRRFRSSARASRARSLASRRRRLASGARRMKRLAEREADQADNVPQTLVKPLAAALEQSSKPVCSCSPADTQAKSASSSGLGQLAASLKRDPEAQAERAGAQSGFVPTTVETVVGRVADTIGKPKELATGVKEASQMVEDQAEARAGKAEPQEGNSNLGERPKGVEETARNVEDMVSKLTIKKVPSKVGGKASELVEDAGKMIGGAAREAVPTGGGVELPAVGLGKMAADVVKGAGETVASTTGSQVLAPGRKDDFGARAGGLISEPKAASSAADVASEADNLAGQLNVVKTLNGAAGDVVSGVRQTGGSLSSGKVEGALGGAQKLLDGAAREAGKTSGVVELPVGGAGKMVGNIAKEAGDLAGEAAASRTGGVIEGPEEGVLGGIVSSVPVGQVSRTAGGVAERAGELVGDPISASRADKAAVKTAGSTLEGAAKLANGIGKMGKVGQVASSLAGEAAEESQAARSGEEKLTEGLSSSTAGAALQGASKLVKGVARVAGKKAAGVAATAADEVEAKASEPNEQEEEDEEEDEEEEEEEGEKAEKAQPEAKSSKAGQRGPGLIAALGDKLMHEAADQEQQQPKVSEKSSADEHKEEAEPSSSAASSPVSISASTSPKSEAEPKEEAKAAPVPAGPQFGASLRPGVRPLEPMASGQLLPGVPARPVPHKLLLKQPRPPYYESPRVGELPASCTHPLGQLTGVINEILALIESVGQRVLSDSKVDYLAREKLSRQLAKVRAFTEESRMLANLGQLRLLNESARQAGIELMRLANAKLAFKLEEALRPLALKTRQVYIAYRKSCKGVGQ